MQKKTMILQVVHPDSGETTDIPLMKDRFNHADFHTEMPSMRFQEMDGWSILDALVPIILFYRPYCIVELGAGESTKHLARFAELYNVKLYSCDKAFKKNIVYNDNHIFAQRFTWDFMEEFDDTPAVVLIDAYHEYENAKKEFEFFFERLVPGGVIFLHDTMPPAEEYLSLNGCADVYKLRQELEKREDIECFTWPYTAGYMGLTMVIKKETERDYWER